MKKLFPLFLLASLLWLPAQAVTNAKRPITDYNTASASAAMVANTQYKYTLTADLTASSFTGTTEGSTIVVALLGCDGTHVFNFPSSKRFGDANSPTTSLTPTAGNHIVTFSYIGSTWYYADSVASLNPSLTTIELGASATDTTISRVSAGVAAIENNVISTVNPRITAITSSATPTFNTDTCDVVNITALAVDITSMVTNKTGTASNFQQLEFRIRDNGTARAITLGADYASGIATLPTTTTVNKALCVYFEYDSVQAKWMCQATGSYP